MDVETMRPDARKSTTTLYYKQRAQTARPATTKAVPVGPGQKVIAGELRYAYDVASGSKGSMQKTQDFAEILAAHRQSQAAAKVAKYTSGSPHPEARPSTAATSGPEGSSKKVVYWDGKQHHIVDVAAATPGGFNWNPPHLKTVDVEAGCCLGVRETPTAPTVKLIGSKYRYLPSMEPGGPSLWARPPSETPMYPTFARPQSTDSGSRAYRNLTSTYASHKLMGHKEYEATTKLLNGLGTFEKTQQHLMSSMAIGRPSRLTGPAEHMNTLTFTGLASHRSTQAKSF